MSDRASAPESAKLLKAALRTTFPATRFSVTLGRGTAYGMADVRWTDGPTVKAVQPILNQFEGEGFDGMTDSAYPKFAPLADGRRSGLRLINWSRHISLDLARRCVAQIAPYWGVEPVELVPDHNGKGWEIVGGDRKIRNDVPDYWTTHIYRASGDASLYHREMVA